MTKKDIRKDLRIIAISMAVYTVNRIFKNSIDIPVVGYLCRCHLNDFIGGIVFTAYVNILLIYNKYPPLHKLGHILLLVLFAGISWEYILPLFIHRGVSDFWDVVSYTLGGIFYWIILITSKSKNSKI